VIAFYKLLRFPILVWWPNKIPKKPCALETPHFQVCDGMCMFSSFSGATPSPKTNSLPLKNRPSYAPKMMPEKVFQPSIFQVLVSRGASFFHCWALDDLRKPSAFKGLWFHPSDHPIRIPSTHPGASGRCTPPMPGKIFRQKTLEPLGSMGLGCFFPGSSGSCVSNLCALKFTFKRKLVKRRNKYYTYLEDPGIYYYI